jgi:hypothetical protein
MKRASEVRFFPIEEFHRNPTLDPILAECIHTLFHEPHSAILHLRELTVGLANGG